MNALFKTATLLSLSCFFFVSLRSQPPNGQVTPVYMTIENVVDDGITYEFDVVAECADTFLLNTFQIYFAYNNAAFGLAIVRNMQFSNVLNNNPDVNLYDSLPPPLPFPKYKLINIIDNSPNIVAITADTRFLVPTPACFPTDTGRVTRWAPGEKKAIARISLTYVDNTQIPGVSLALSLMLNQFIGGNGNCQLVQGDISVLPVSFLHVEAEAKRFGGVDLLWDVLENGQEAYEIERQFPGGLFEKIAEVKSTGERGETMRYHYTDPTQEIGEVNYRIRSTDTDGAIYFSETVTVNIEELNPGYSIFPNPALDVVYVQGLSDTEDTRIRIVDMQGKLYLDDIMQDTGVSIKDLPAGVYILRVQQRNLRFIKK